MQSFVGICVAVCNQQGGFDIITLSISTSQRRCLQSLSIYSMAQNHHVQFIEKHKHCTIEQLKGLYYNGQGQVDQGNSLWKNHLQVCREGVLEELERDIDRRKEVREVQISREKYKILQRYHKKQMRKEHTHSGRPQQKP